MTLFLLEVIGVVHSNLILGASKILISYNAFIFYCVHVSMMNFIFYYYILLVVEFYTSQCIKISIKISKTRCTLTGLMALRAHFKINFSKAIIWTYTTKFSIQLCVLAFLV